MSAPPARVFIGSSSEGLEIARNLKVELESASKPESACEGVLWSQNVFEVGGYTLDSLITKASGADFAVLVATPDDTTVSRGESMPSVRDNVVLEFGLFAGVLGRNRTFLLPTGKLRLPTDVLGLTVLPFRPQSDGNLRGALTEATLQVEERVRSLGRRTRHDGRATGTGHPVALERELDLLCDNAVAQGWTVKTNSPTTLRLISPKGKPHTLPKRQPGRTREDLRRFAAEVRADGLRVNSSIWRPVEESPF